MPLFSRTTLNTSIENMVSGAYSSTDFDEIILDAVRHVLADVDLRSTKRKAALSPNLFDDIYQYGAPSDLKGNKIIDVKPQIDRGRFDQWTLVTEEEFDRMKEDEGNHVALSHSNFAPILLLSTLIDDEETVVSVLDAVGDWEGYGDGENLTRDADNYVKGSASINWDINADGGTTAGIYNDSLSIFDVSDYLTEGSIFVWAYLSSKTDVTNFITRIGSSASAYYSITVTTNNEGNSFHNGWNLIRFDFVNKSETGTVDDDGCDYVALYMTKATGKISETDYRFDNLVMKVGDHYNVIYYSKYGWQTSAGAYAETATGDTDLLNAETDEYLLICLKVAELMERHLKNLDEAKILEERYERKKTEYVMDYPSEALILMQTYHFL